jgi:hypothetical protein
VTVQALPETWSQPLQDANVDCGPGAAVNVTVEPAAKFALHVVPQAIPAGVLVTVPGCPATVAVSGYVATAKLAVTFLA